jgi:ABC-type cobalamin/Fe3+-siderophores transport system ATPase subunit
MQITAIHMPLSEGYGDGLQAIEMTRLGRIVVIAGENGSGKTRFLNRLSHRATLHRDMSTEVIRAQLPHHVQMVSQTNGSQKTAYINIVTASNQSLYLRDAITFSSPLIAPPDIVYFVPKGLVLKDPQKLTPDKAEQSANLVKQRGVNGLADGCFAYIQLLQNKHREATHQDTIHSKIEIATAVQDYESLDELIKRFLGIGLTRSLDGKASLFGRPLGDSGLSDGQKILVQFCAAIHAQGADINRLIILMDEPENHLHPSAMLDAIDAIDKNLPDGQIWIATHSIPLLSHFDTSSIWWMKDGSVGYAGTIPQTVLKGLLGSEERIQKLSDFLNLPAELAINRFAYQSLLSPKPVTTDSDDPQTSQINEILEKFKVNKTIKILDFGAGRGRLPSAIYETFGKPDLETWLDYIAFDPNKDHKADCESAIARIYGNSSGRYFNDPSEVRSSFDPGIFDAIIMCNVLHEIDPALWLELLDPKGVIMHLLKDTGFLLLVEDNQMPIGEKPYQNGFLVLDTEQVKTLFSIKSSDSNFKIHSKNEGRLKAHEIPKACLSRITDATRKEAIKSVCLVAKEKIRLLRSKEGSYPNGRAHAYWVQQFANGHLFLAGSGGI